MEYENETVRFGYGFSLPFVFRELRTRNEKPVESVEHCKKDCPKAKSDEDAHKCAEKIGKLNKEFRKGKCWEENEKYEASQAAK